MSSKPERLLLEAASKGSVKGVKDVLRKHASVNVNCRDKARCTPLQLAAMKRADGIVRQLLECGADVNIAFPLHAAVDHSTSDLADDPSCAQALVEVGGADVNRLDMNGATPLMLAAMASNISIVKYLASLPAINLNAYHGTTKETTDELLERLKPPAYDEMLAAIIDFRRFHDTGLPEPMADRVPAVPSLDYPERKAPTGEGDSKEDLNEDFTRRESKEHDFDAGDPIPSTPDTRAALHHDPYDARNAPPATDRAGPRTVSDPLLLGACTSGDVDEVQKMISYGASVHVLDDIGRTPLHLAASGRHANVLRLLLRQPGVDLELADIDNRRPVHAAVQVKGSTEGVEWDDPTCLQLLIEHGADANAIRKDGLAPLDVAISGGLINIVRYLAPLPQVSARLWEEHNGKTPVALADALGATEIATFLHEVMSSASARSAKQAAEDGGEDGSASLADIAAQVGPDPVVNKDDRGCCEAGCSIM